VQQEDIAKFCRKSLLIGKGGEFVTVALTVQVNDGLVMAADSATTMEFTNKQELVYNHANSLST